MRVRRPLSSLSIQLIVVAFALAVIPSGQTLGCDDPPIHIGEMPYWMHDDLPASGTQFCDPEGPFGLPGVSGTPDQVGEWEPVVDWADKAVHLNLMPNGKVMYWYAAEPLGTPPTTTWLWDPVSNTHKPIVAPDSELFCAGHTLLADGRLFAMGGTNGDLGFGPVHADIFDPATETWTRVADMNYGRYYPSSLLLEDGRVFIISGTVEVPEYGSPVQVGTPEIYDPVSDTYEAHEDAYLQLATYPRTFLLPDGRIAVVGPSRPLYVLDPTDNSWQVEDWADWFSADGGATMYEPGKIVITGGQSPPGQGPVATAETAVIDFADENPEWRTTASANQPKSWVDLIMLPDGSVLNMGGATGGGWHAECATHAPEIWDPVTETWTVMASHQRPREYHATVLLLPDARVLVAGGENLQMNGEENAEIYSPPYLFQGPRPVIDDSPSHVAYGDAFNVRTNEAGSIASIVFMRPGSVTHAFTQTHPAYVPLGFQQTGANRLEVVAPAHGNLAPPGPYMMFLVDTNGVPSVAEFVSLGSCTATQATEGSCLDGVDNDCDGLADLADLDCGPAPLPFAPSGAVPGGQDGSGNLLRIARTPGGSMTLTWDASCAAGDTDYAIYEGALGDFSSVMPVFCSTNGQTTRTFDRVGDNFYLVVPNNGSREGSYGVDGNGVDRPLATGACLPQEVGECGAP